MTLVKLQWNDISNDKQTWSQQLLFKRVKGHLCAPHQLSELYIIELNWKRNYYNRNENNMLMARLPMPEWQPAPRKAKATPRQPTAIKSPADSQATKPLTTHTRQEAPATAAWHNGSYSDRQTWLACLNPSAYVYLLSDQKRSEWSERSLTVPSRGYTEPHFSVQKPLSTKGFFLRAFTATKPKPYSLLAMWGCFLAGFRAPNQSARHTLAD